MEHEHTPSALPLDSLSPLQLRAHAELRSDVATLMAPYMFDGIEAASMLAGHLGAESPKERYDAVLATTLALLDMPESREAYAMRYPEFQDRIPVTKQFSRIYDFHFPILIEAAIIDAGWVGLGAARFLESSGRIDEASAIIPRSFGLLSIAKANKDCVLGLRNELGNPHRSG